MIADLKIQPREILAGASHAVRVHGTLFVSPDVHHLLSTADACELASLLAQLPVLDVTSLVLESEAVPPAPPIEPFIFEINRLFPDYRGP